jgi:hypothetical protein
MSRREWNYTSQLIWEAQEMGKHIIFFPGADMTQHTYQLIAKCKTCGEIVAAIEDNPANADENRSVIKTWKDADYTVDRATVAYVRARFSSRGCTCVKEKGA